MKTANVSNEFGANCFQSVINGICQTPAPAEMHVPGYGQNALYNGG